MWPLYRHIVVACLLLTYSTVFGQSCGYGFSKTITIDHTKVGGYAPLLDFPVLIDLTDNDLRTTGNGGDVQNANGYDIVFVDGASGQRLAHQVERYVATAGHLVAWVRVPILYPDFDSEIRILYGNAQVNADPSTTATWDQNFQSVWHLHDDLEDGTDLGNDGTNSGSADATGLMADAQTFDGTDDHIYRTDASWNGDVPSLSSGSPNEFTLSGWINVDNLNNRQPLLSKQGSGTGTDRGFVFMMEDDNRAKIELFKNNDSGTRTEVYSTTTLTTNTWYYIVTTYEFVTDGTSRCRVYLNGAEEGTTDAALGPIVANSRDVEIGRYYWSGTTNYWMDGEIDEVRISNTVRSAGWIETEYENQSDPSSFYSVGSEVAGITNPSLPVCGAGFKRSITIDNTEVSGSSNLIDFPVLVDITNNDLRTVANGGNVENDNGWDIVFTDENLVALDHDLESYDPSTGEVVAWVRIPSLPATSDHTFYMFYGDPNVFLDPSTPCTWADYDGVWHLHDDFLDATVNDEDGTNNGSTDNTTSQIADGQSFDGTDFIELTSFPNKTTDFTLSGWIRTTDNTEQGQRVFCDDESNSGGYALSLGDGGTGSLRFFSRGMNTVILDGPTNAIANNTWYYVAGVADRSNQDRFIYIDGVLNASDLTDGGTWGTDNGDASIGGETAAGETGNRFEGALDEIRISSVARSANWLLTEYNNQSSPSTFYTLGSEEDMDVTSTQDGFWDETTTWAGGSIPGNGANVTLQHEVDLDDRDIVLCNLTIESTADIASFEVENARRAVIVENVYLNGNGANSVMLGTDPDNATILIKQDLLMTQEPGSGAMYIDVENAGDSIHVLGNLVAVHDGGGFMEVLVDNATGVLKVDGNASFFMNDDTNEDDLELDLNAGNMIVDGFLSIRRDNAFNDVRLDLDGGFITADSLYIGTFNTSGSDDIEVDIDGASEINVTNGMVIDMDEGDDIDLFLNTINGTSAELNVGGDFSIFKKGGSNLSITVDEANSEINVGGKMEIVSTGGALTQLQVNGGFVSVTDSFILQQLDGGTQFWVDINGNSTITSGDLIATLDNNGNQELLIDIDNASNWTVNGDMILTINDGNDLELHLGQNTVSSSAALNITGDVLLDHNPSSGGDDIQFIISDVTSVDIGGNFTMNTDGASGAGNFYTQLNGNSTLTVGGDITFTGANGSGEIEIEMNGTTELFIGGDFIRDAVPNNYGLLESNSTTARITYNGVGAQVFADEDGAGTDGIEYERVVINNTFATEPQLTMEAAVTLANQITFTDGVLQTTATDLLSLADDAISNDGNAGSYVSGPLQKVGNDPFVFPLGKGGTWARLELSNLTGSTVTDAFTAEYFNTPFSEGFIDSNIYAGDPGGMFNTSTLEYWELDRDAGSAQPIISLYWESNVNSVITDTADLVVAHYLGATTWKNEGGNASGALAAGKVSTTGNINSFSPFTFGSVTPFANPLPVELLDFDAVPQQGTVLVQWITATEINNDHFHVQRSADGIHFNTIATVEGAGNSNRRLAYDYLDQEPLPGTSYYRLEQVDFDGTSAITKIRSVIMPQNSDAWLIYPNPAADHLYSNKPMNGTLTDALGREVMRMKGELSLDIRALTSGIYYLNIQGENVRKVVVE